MIAIRNYNNTHQELKSAKRRLELLEARAEKIFDMFFPTTTSIQNELIKTMSRRDRQVEYQIEMDRIRPETGMSLRKEIEQTKNEVRQLQYYLGLMEHDLKEMEGVEYDLYYEIVINRANAKKSISRIIEEYSERTYLDENAKTIEVNTLWVNYYPKIKKYLEKLEKSSENQVNCMK